MAILLTELKERLAIEFDEITLLEMLDIDSEQLVQAFADKIEERYDILVGKMGADEWR